MLKIVQNHQITAVIEKHTIPITNTVSKLIAENDNRRKQITKNIVGANFANRSQRSTCFSILYDFSMSSFMFFWSIMLIFIADYKGLNIRMLCIGNGESRKDIDIDKLDIAKVGCNAVYRDYAVDYLVCVDKRMVSEAIRAKANETALIYTREDWYKNFAAKSIRRVPPLPYKGEQRWDEPFQWGSGPYAVLIAAMFTKEHCVHMIGFDLYSKTKTVNNVYKGTPNYDDANKRAVDPRYWIHQIGMVFNCFPKIQFKIYQEPDWELPKAWNYPNVTVDMISNIYYNT